MLKEIKKLIRIPHDAKPDGEFCKTCGEPTWNKTFTVGYSIETGEPNKFKTRRYCINSGEALDGDGYHEPYPWY